MDRFQYAYHIPKHDLQRIRVIFAFAVDRDQAADHFQKSFPEDHFLLCTRRRWYFLHILVKISEICIFQNDIIRVLANEAAVAPNDIWSLLQPSEGF